MTSGDVPHIAPAILPPEAQRAVWFMGALVRIRAGGDATGGRLAILEHEAERGYGTPLHLHHAADETFLVLDGELRAEVDGQVHTAGAGAAAFLPRGLPHSLVVTSPRVRYISLHTPSGFDAFTIAVSTPTANDPPPDPAALAALAAAHEIEILGPPPVLDA